MGGNGGRDESGGTRSGEKTGREMVLNLRKTTPRHQMAGYGPAHQDM